MTSTRFAMPKTPFSRAALALTAFTLAAPIALTGCSAPSAGTHTAGPDSSSTHSAEEAGEANVTVADAWAKATAEDMTVGEGMTGVFAVLTNHGDADITITGVDSDAAAMVELHEVVDGVMRKISGDVTIPAGGTLTLEPGGDHIMLMDMKEPLFPGDDVVVSLALSDGTTLAVTALVKDTSGANESYDDLGAGHDAH